MSERWERIAELYHSALARNASERAAHLREGSAGDECLRREVEKLLEYDAKAGNFLERPAVAADNIPEVTRTIVAIPDQRIGPYEVGTRLGVGGMGEVYLATDMRLGRRVALKLLLREMSADPDSRARFLREARSAAALSHTHIAAVFDAGEANGRFYLAMELIEGKSLRSMLHDGPLPESVTIEFAMQLASALEHAHSRGILHRDIKPQNILVDTAGAAKLVDFGIAKTLSAESDDTEITRPGVFVGTLKYAAPEVLSGEPASRQSDLYSLGVTLFEMACGKTPFDGRPAMGAVGAILQGEPIVVRDVNPAVSEGLGEIIERSMARTPADRFSSAAEMLAALQSTRDSGGARAGALPEPGRVPSLAILEFANVSRDPSLDWLGVGIVETLEGELRKLAGLQVASRMRTQQVIRGLGLKLEEPSALVTLGRRLGTKWIASGSFQRAANRIRVLTSVLDVATGESVPTEKVDGAWEDLFDVQDRVVTALKQALQIESGSSAMSWVQPASAPSLDAYEHYSLGRQCLNQMGRDSLVQAKQHFEKAIALNPGYALAHAGLGSSHALTFIQTSNPEEMQRALPHLERAIQLDPELGEPYPWLCYIYSRSGEPVKALAAGEQGVKRQPDLAQAHYFYSGVLLTTVEIGLGNYQKAMDGLIRSLILDPRIAAQWIVSGSGALGAGQYEAASKLLAAAWHMEKAPASPFRFVGAQTLLGFVHTRQLDWDRARQFHQDALESLRDAQHVYRDVFRTLSACGLGEIELRAGRAEEGLTHFRHAWRLVKEEPRMVGNLRLGIRAQAGMAGCYAGLGERDRAEQHLTEAASRLTSVDLRSWTFETYLSYLYYSIASAQLRLGLAPDAITSLSHALDAGWTDPHWFESDPEWESLRGRKDYRQLVERVRLIPPVTVDLSGVPFFESSTSNEGTAPRS